VGFALTKLDPGFTLGPIGGGAQLGTQVQLFAKTLATALVEKKKLRDYDK